MMELTETYITRSVGTNSRPISRDSRVVQAGTGSRPVGRDSRVVQAGSDWRPYRQALIREL